MKKSIQFLILLFAFAINAEAEPSSNHDIIARLGLCRSDSPQSNLSLNTSRIIRMDNRSISTSRSEKVVDHS